LGRKENTVLIKGAETDDTQGGSYLSAIALTSGEPLCWLLWELTVWADVDSVSSFTTLDSIATAAIVAAIGMATGKEAPEERSDPRERDE
jgi:hypothetical protein